MKKIIYIVVAAALTGCGTMGAKRVVLDSSGDKPKWAEGAKVVWQADDSVYFKSKYTVKQLCMA